jgi:shikimate dehydrogenase
MLLMCPKLPFHMRLFGLIGYPLGHSFSKRYFSEKFTREHIADARYELFPLENIRQLEQLLATRPQLQGLNVTIPYKEAVLPFLHELDSSAAEVGAVNCIRIRSGRRKGFNTDVFGFDKSLTDFWSSWPAGKQALVLGSGGASKAVTAVLRRRGLPYQVVSRNGGFTYTRLHARASEILEKTALIVHTTPLGMAPDVDGCPDLPYSLLGPQHFVYDLVYNPAETLLLRRASGQGCQTCNGLPMLYGQAEKAWEIWNQSDTPPDT